MNIKVMIPVRLGSRRVPKKNLRLLGDKPLVEYIINISKKVFDSDDIYLNSEAEIFRDIADKQNINFYKRPEWYASDEATNDDFLYDFLIKHECDWVVQAHSTSPFITVDDINKFVTEIQKNNDIDALFSVKEEQIETLYRDNPINFKVNQQMPPSQDLKPVEIFCNGLMAFKRDSFIKYYEEKGFSMFAGHFHTIPLKGYSTLDIDNEEDFKLAEGILESKRKQTPVHYYERNKKFDSDVPSILREDGIDSWNDKEVAIINLTDIYETYSESETWARRVINSDSNSVTLINQNRGEGNRLHYHNNWNEWWLITRGKWKFTINNGNHIVEEGDFVYIPKGAEHKIIAIRDDSTRIAVSREDVTHIYKQDDFNR